MPWRAFQIRLASSPTTPKIIRRAASQWEIYLGTTIPLDNSSALACPPPLRIELNDDGGAVSEQVTYMFGMPEEAGTTIRQQQWRF